MEKTTTEQNDPGENNRSPDWSGTTRRTVALIALASGVTLLWFVREIIPIVIISALLAFILNPVVTFLSHRVLAVPFIPEGARRGWAALLSFVLMIVAVTIGLLVLVPVIVNQVQDFGSSLPEVFERLERNVMNILSEPITFQGEPILLDDEPLVPLERLTESLGIPEGERLIRFDMTDVVNAAESLLNSLGDLSGPAFSFLGGAFNTVINVIFVIVLTFYLLKDSNLFIRNTLSLVPEAYRSDVQRLLVELRNVWNAYVRGQIIISIVMGLAVYLAALLLGVPNAPMLGLLAGLFEFIPNIGPFLALIPAALFGLVSRSATLPFLEGVVFMLVIIFVWTMLQNLESIFLVPRIMGDSLKLHPLVVILAVMSGAAIAGIIGVILAAPFVASGRVIAMYIYGKLMSKDPFPEQDVDPPSIKKLPLLRAINTIWRWLRARLPQVGRHQVTDSPAQ